MNLEIISTALLGEYLEHVSVDLQPAFDALKDAEMSTNTFSFYTSVSSVFSSKIEGEDIELDSYVRHKKFDIEFQPDYTRKTDDLYNAYLFAQHHELNGQNISEAHKILGRNLLAEHLQEKFRSQNMYVSTDDGRIEYVAASPFEVAAEMEKLYRDIAILLQSQCGIREVFFYASMIHLVFVKIHPWNDGNGRSARLLEKWFLAQKLGEKAWFVQSEKNYYTSHHLYYQHVRALGLEYPELDYTQALPFLLMLPQSVIYK